MFKAGDLIVCIKKHYYITEHTLYEVKNVLTNYDGNTMLLMKVDCDITQWYEPEFFISLKEYRKLKLQKLEMCDYE